MSWMDRFLGGAPRGGIPRHAPPPDQPHELVLYKYDACPYCQRVLRVVDAIGIPLTMKDTRVSSDYRRELLSATGRTQVPCLFIDGQPLFESEDIVAWLRAYQEANG